MRKLRLIPAILNLALFNAPTLHALTGSGHELFLAPMVWAAESNKSKSAGATFKFEPAGFEKQALLASQRTVDFLITDKPPLGSRNFKVIPIALSALTVAYRLDRFSGQLKIRPEVLKSIIDGKITAWNDPKLVADNPELSKLPGAPIVFVHSKENYGLLQIFGAQMKRKKLRLNKPRVGVRVDLQRTVASTIKHTDGGIGLVDYGWKDESGLKGAALLNSANQFIAPNRQSLGLSSEIVMRQLKGDFRSIILNPRALGGYPIFGFIYLVILKGNLEGNERSQMKAILDKLLSASGDEMVSKVGFEPLSSEQKKAVNGLL